MLNITPYKNLIVLSISGHMTKTLVGLVHLLRTIKLHKPGRSTSENLYKGDDVLNLICWEFVTKQQDI